MGYPDRYVVTYGRKTPTATLNTRRARLGKIVLQGWASFFPEELV